MKWFLSLISITQALPVNQNYGYQFLENSPDVTTICVYNELVYPSGANFTTDNPCESCICDPPEYRCTLKTCNLKYGCKTIQKADRCCPEYVCDCEINGKTYANGEKVEEPNPCKVCYCKGGEIKCTSITCYSRDDCEPVYVEGKCCPKYDDCPPLEMMRNLSVPAQPTAVVVFDLVPPSFKTDEGKKPTVVFEWAITSSDQDIGNESEFLSVKTSTTYNPQDVTMRGDEHFIFENGSNETESWKRVTDETSKELNESIDNSSKNIDLDSSEKWNELNGSDSMVFEVIYGSDNQTQRSEFDPGNNTSEFEYIDGYTISELNSQPNSTENLFLDKESPDGNETLRFETEESEQTEEETEEVTTEETEVTTEETEEVTTEETIQFANTTLQNISLVEFSERQNVTKKLQETKNALDESEIHLLNDTISDVINDENLESKVNESITELPNENATTPIVQITRRSNSSSGVIEEISIPGLKMIHEQIQYLQVGEASPVYVDFIQSLATPIIEAETSTVALPKTTPTTVETIEVIEMENSTLSN